MEIDRLVYQNRFRRKRFKAFLALVKISIASRGFCKIADIGGRMESWEAFRSDWIDLPIKVSVLDLEKQDPIDVRFESIAVDARDLSNFTDLSFDFVYCNSVIEHVGIWSDQQRFAEEINRISAKHFVQTPNYWFPYEPHFRMLFIHWLPSAIQIALMRCFSLGFYPRATSSEHAIQMLGEARLLNARQLATLFPKSYIYRERFFLTKSLIAIR